METYENYRGYGIYYSSMTGTTVVEDGGVQIAIFKRQGESNGSALAKAFIDNLFT